jgi:hypothetical protein
MLQDVLVHGLLLSRQRMIHRNNSSGCLLETKDVPVLWNYSSHIVVSCPQLGSFADLRVSIQRFRHSLRKSVYVIRRHKHSPLASFQDFCGPARAIGCHYAASTCQRLNQCIRKSLTTRAEHEDCTSPKPWEDRVYKAWEKDIATDSKGVHPPFEGWPLRAFTQNKKTRDPTFTQLGKRIHKHVIAFVRYQASRGKNYRGPGFIEPRMPCSALHGLLDGLKLQWVGNHPQEARPQPSFSQILHHTFGSCNDRIRMSVCPRYAAHHHSLTPPDLLRIQRSQVRGLPQHQTTVPPGKACRDYRRYIGVRQRREQRNRLCATEITVEARQSARHASCPEVYFFDARIELGSHWTGRVADNQINPVSFGSKAVRDSYHNSFRPTAAVRRHE